MKHKHAELIHAWADGAQIQWRDLKDDERWSDIRIPNWLEDCEYRIKPEPDVIRNITVEATLFYGEPFVQVFKSEYLFPNLRLIFDRETGKLKAAEVL